MRMEYNNMAKEERAEYVTGNSNKMVQSQSPSGNMLRRGKKKAKWFLGIDSWILIQSETNKKVYIYFGLAIISDKI